MFPLPEPEGADGVRDQARPVLQGLPAPLPRSGRDVSASKDVRTAGYDRGPTAAGICIRWGKWD